MKPICELISRWFKAWCLEKARARKYKHERDRKLMASLQDLTDAVTAAAAAGTAVAAAIDNAVAKGIGGGGGSPPPDLQPTVDAVNAITAAVNTAKDKLVAATPA